MLRLELIVVVFLELVSSSYFFVIILYVVKLKIYKIYHVKCSSKKILVLLIKLCRERFVWRWNVVEYWVNQEYEACTYLELALRSVPWTLVSRAINLRQTSHEFTTFDIHLKIYRVQIRLKRLVFSYYGTDFQHLWVKLKRTTGRYFISFLSLLIGIKG